MSTQAQVNASPAAYILYYNRIGQSDATIYNINLSDVCFISFDSSGALSIGGWQIIAYGPPDNATLLSYVNATVLAWFRNNYQNPVNVADNQPYEISSADLSAMAVGAAQTGFLVLDTTAQELKTYDGSTWAALQTSSSGFYLPLAGGTMTGAIDLNTNNLTDVGTLSGATNSRTADDIVSNAGISASGNVAIFSGTSGKVIQDSGTMLSAYLPLAGGTMSGSIALGTNNLSNVGAISGATNSCLADNIVNNVGSSVTGDVAVFSGSTGKVVSDTGIVAANVVTNVGVSTAGHVAIFSDASGKIIQDGGAMSTYLPLAGGTMIGDIDMNGNNIANVNLMSGATNTFTVDNVVTNVGASTTGHVATFSDVTGKIIQDGGASLSSYLPLAGGTMTGDINMNGHGINNVTLIQTGTGNTLVGDSATGSSLAVAIGRNAAAGTNQGTAVGAAATANALAVAVGSSSVCGSSNSVAIGDSASAASQFNIAIGQTANASGGPAAIAIGSNTVASGNRSIAIGDGASNGTGHSILLGDSAIVNVRPNSAVCDLGTSADPFQNLWSGNARTLGFPSMSAIYCAYAALTVSGTAAETDISTNAGSIGSLLFSTLPTGMVFLMNTSFAATTVAGDTLTLRFYTNVSTLLGSLAITLGAGASNDSVQTIFSVRSSTVGIVHMGDFASGGQSNNAPAIVAGSPNTFSMTAQFGLNTSSLTVNLLAAGALFVNGA